MISVLLLAVRTSALRAPIAIRRSRMAALGRRSRMATLGAGSVEVEEKFAVSGDRDAFAARVKAAGGSATSSVRFHDEYFDTAALALTSQDTWLRRRDGAWELKIPHGDRVASGGETTVFREVEDEAQIVGELAALGVPGETLPFPGLDVFAEFTTFRDKYALPGRVRVDVDEASYGHRVLELEVMTDGSPEDVAAARAEIDAAAAELGCERLGDGAGGKLETYLRRYCPAHAKAIGLL